MTRRFLSLSVILAATCSITACDTPEPKVTNAKIEELRRELPGFTEACLEKFRFGGIEAVPDSTDACFKMAKRAHWRGLWRNNFEGSRFCPAPAKKCSYETRGDDIWLTFPTDKGRPKDIAIGGLYSIDFIGRRTEVRGFYGHLGGSQHEIIVDRLISLTPVTQ